MTHQNFAWRNHPACQWLSSSNGCESASLHTWPVCEGSDSSLVWSGHTDAQRIEQCGVSVYRIYCVCSHRVQTGGVVPLDQRLLDLLGPFESLQIVWPLTPQQQGFFSIQLHYWIFSLPPSITDVLVLVWRSQWSSSVCAVLRPAPVWPTLILTLDFSKCYSRFFHIAAINKQVNYCKGYDQIHPPLSSPDCCICNVIWFVQWILPVCLVTLCQWGWPAGLKWQL